MIFGIVRGELSETGMADWLLTENAEDMLLGESRFLPCGTLEEGVLVLTRKFPCPDAIGNSKVSRVSADAYRRVIRVAKYPRLDSSGDVDVGELISAVRQYGAIEAPCGFRSYTHATIRSQPGFFHSDLVINSEDLILLDPKKAKARKSRELNAGSRKAKKEAELAIASQKRRELDEKREVLHKAYTNLRQTAQDLMRMWPMRRLGLSKDFPDAPSYYQDSFADFQAAVILLRRVAELFGSNLEPLSLPSVRKAIRGMLRVRHFVDHPAVDVGKYGQRMGSARAAAKLRAARNWFFAEALKIYPTGKPPQERSRKVVVKKATVTAG